MFAIPAVMTAGRRISRVGIGRRDGRPGLIEAPFNDLVEFTAIKPYTAAFRAVINFDVLTFGHDQFSICACRAFHN